MISSIKFDVLSVAYRSINRMVLSALSQPRLADRTSRFEQQV